MIVVVTILVAGVMAMVPMTTVVIVVVTILVAGVMAMVPMATVAIVVVTVTNDDDNQGCDWSRDGA